MNRRESGEYHLQPRVLLVGVALLALVCVGLRLDYCASKAPVLSPQLSVKNAVPQVRAVLAGLPLIFEANQGQTDPKVKFMARGSGYGLFLTADEAVLTLQHPSSAQGAASGASVVRMGLVNANPSAPVSGTDKLVGKSNYFIGNDPAKWRRDVPQFARVRYASVYPGIDLVYYGSQGRLEYDFEVAPGADPSQVALQFQGANDAKLDANGDLVLAAQGGDVRLHAPRIYQKLGDQQEPVAGRFVLLGKNQAGFAVESYDRSRALVIDPILTYSTYLGGAGDEGCTAVNGATLPVPNCPAIALDSASNVYIATPTTSPVFPVGTTTSTLSGSSDVLIAELSTNATAGAQLQFSTYVGGSGAESPAGIAIGSGFTVLVALNTNSTDLPTQNAYQEAPASGNHVYMTKFDRSGAVLYATYLAGSGTADIATGFALDNQGKAYITGTTNSSDFPVTANAYQSTAKGATQFFVSKIDPTGSGPTSLMFSTYFGGGNPYGGTAVGGGIAVDTNGGIYITGTTNFLYTGNSTTDFPILNAFQPCLDTPTATKPSTFTCSTSVTATDAFVARFSLTNSSINQTDYQLSYSSYLGGSGNDAGYGVAVDTGNNAYVTGSTASSNFAVPTGITSFQTTNAGGRDVFLAKVNNPSSGDTSLIYSSYLGGTGDEAGTSVALNNLQGATVTGWTTSTDFHTLNPIYASSFGGRDAFLARFDTTATSTSSSNFASYLGGSGADAGTGIVLDGTSAFIYVTGETTSANFPTQNPYSGSRQGASDTFVSVFGPNITGSLTLDPAGVTPSPVGVGNQVAFKYNVTNNGADPVSGITVTANLPSTGATFSSATSAPGSCGSETTSGSASTVTCSVGTLDAGGGVATVTINLIPTAGPTVDNSAWAQAFSGNTPVVTPTQTSTATVNDFQVKVQPAILSVVAGQPADITATVTPSFAGTFPNNVSLSCSSSLPAGAACSFTNNPITSFSGPTSRALVISTTVRTTTTSGLWKKGSLLFYAAWVPLFGVMFLGRRTSGKTSRIQRTMGGLVLGVFFALVLSQAGCGSSGSTKTTSGTPAGTYNITVTGTSGSASRNAVLQLVVQ